MATWKQLNFKKDYKAALERVDALLDIKRTDAQQNEFLLLSYLIVIDQGFSQLDKK